MAVLRVCSLALLPPPPLSLAKTMSVFSREAEFAQLVHHAADVAVHGADHARRICGGRG